MLQSRADNPVVLGFELSTSEGGLATDLSPPDFEMIRCNHFLTIT